MDMDSVVMDSYKLMMSEEQQQHLYKVNGYYWMPVTVWMLLAGCKWMLLNGCILLMYGYYWMTVTGCLLLYGYY